MTVSGTGKLVVYSNSGNGIGSRANLTISGGDIIVSAVNNALKGNDSVIITGGNIILVSKSDGIKDETVDGLGKMTISVGTINITAVNDGIQSNSSIEITEAVIYIKTGGGSSAKVSGDSAKGIKATTSLVINSGTFGIDSNDDCHILMGQ